jgi:hypothetical protein
VASAGCAADAAHVQSCADSLTGTWRASIGAAPDGAPLRYHLVDDGERLELHPLYDSARAAGRDGAEVITLTRTPHGPIGALSFWATHAAGACRASWPAEIRACRANRLQLFYRPGPIPTPPDCRAPAGPDWVEVRLQRE